LYEAQAYLPVPFNSAKIKDISLVIFWIATVLPPSAHNSVPFIERFCKFVALLKSI